ncbi:MAG: hypothetical protein JSW33_04605 [bacterium]|nr:MAG: hypothetical protein JSW33_04605 [bacterium]
MSSTDFGNSLEALKQEMLSLKERIVQLENRSQHPVNLPRTMLLSDSFLARAFAVLGLYIVSSLIIFIPLYAIIIVFMLMFGLFN